MTQAFETAFHEEEEIPHLVGEAMYLAKQIYAMKKEMEPLV